MFRHSASLALLAGLTLPLMAPAAVLTKLNERSTRAIFSGPELEFAQIGDRMKVGSNCEMVIDRKLNESDNRVGVNAAACADRLALQIGAEGALISVVGDNTELERTSDVAASTMSTRSSARSLRATVVRTPKEQMMKGLGVGLILSNMNKDSMAKEVYDMPFGGSVHRTLENENSSTGSAGVNLNYSYVPRSGIGFMGDMMLSQVNKIISSDSYMFIRPAANAVFGFRDKFYLSGGVNYMMFLQEPGYSEGIFEGQRIKMKPELGWQVGGGMVWNDTWQAQVQYVTAKQSMNQTLNTENLGTISGARVVGDYDFTSLEMTLQYRF
ncbi:MAG TPA: hypothetical protein PL182_00120 [Pseudobdellovibrionaceae bacterium]|nr:hypothetical protein [Pseudobdellovibrionaceae bacterium]